MTRIYLFLMLVLGLTSCLSREERIKRENEKGKSLVEEKASYAKGVGDALKKDGKGAAESISEGVGEVFKGLNKGFDKSLTKVEVKPSADVEKDFELGRTGKHHNDSTAATEVVIYLIFKNDVSATLQLKALDADGLELGRKKMSVKGKKDDALYASFEFDKRTPLDVVESFTLDLVK